MKLKLLLSAVLVITFSQFSFAGTQDGLTSTTVLGITSTTTKSQITSSTITSAKVGFTLTVASLAYCTAKDVIATPSLDLHSVLACTVDFFAAGLDITENVSGELVKVINERAENKRVEGFIKDRNNTIRSSLLGVVAGDEPNEVAQLLLRGGASDNIQAAREMLQSLHNE